MQLRFISHSLEKPSFGKNFIDLVIVTYMLSDLDQE